MNDKVFYMRLSTGDELVAEVISDKPGLSHIVLENPLMIEVQEDGDGAQMIFFSRYNPYAKDTSVRLERNDVVLLQTASEVVSDYYTKSVDFCKAYIDKKFVNGISTAASYVDKVLKQLAMDGIDSEVDPPEAFDENDEFIDEQLEVSVSKPTIH